jgi:hypothetical protein
MKRVDDIVRSDAAGLDAKDQTNVRFYVAMDVACTSAGKVELRAQDIAGLTLAVVTDDMIRQAQQRVVDMYQALGPTDQTAKGADLIGNLKTDLLTRFV